ncbi:MAG: NAD-dependent epimerase/dehydratase family protein [Acidobacteria bacterium]|nr:NAD-dependent epimerase/dehydratase family protein [Acidobacteriota bacterium]
MQATISKVLVTGGTGFIGSHVVQRLCAEGFSVRVLARPTSLLDSLEGLPVEIAAGDLQDKNSLQRAVKDCQTVFHVAADYRLWVRDPMELYRSNVDGTKNMLAVAREAGISRMVYTSTVGTIGVPRNGADGTEEDFPDPRTLSGPYKRSKFLAEQEVLRHAREGFPVVIVNPTAPVGEGDRKPTETGKMILDFLNRRMPAYIDTGLNLVDVRDVAAGHLAALHYGKPGQRYILGGRNMSFKEILDALAQITGLASPCWQLPFGVALCAGAVNSWAARFTGRPPRIPFEAVKMARYKMYASSAKAKRELGYRSGPVENALERAIAWFRENGKVQGGLS